MNRIFLVSLIALMVMGCTREKNIPEDIGLQFYSLRNQFDEDIPGTLSMISDWGVKTIEGGETYGMELEKFLMLLDQHDLQVVSIGADFDELASSPQISIQKARAYGAKYIMCPWIPHDGDNFTFEDIQNAVNVFNRAGKQISEAGLQLVYHPHGYEFRPHGQGNLMDYMLQNSEHYKFEMDVYWFTHGGADPMEYLNAYPEKFKLMHLKDMEKGVQGNDSGQEDVETNVVLGTGQINIEALVRQGREVGVEYMFIEDESSRSVDQIPMSLEYLGSLQ